MIKANIILDKPLWKKKLKNPNNYFKKKLKKIKNNFPQKKENQEFSILLTNNKKMKELNYRFRKKNKATDILSFPFFKKKNYSGYIGDLAISYEIINRRSKKTNFNFEFDKIWIHGYLHLIGYDHKKNSEFKKMISVEKKILNCLEH